MSTSNPLRLNPFEVREVLQERPLNACSNLSRLNPFEVREVLQGVLYNYTLPKCLNPFEVREVLQAVVRLKITGLQMSQSL